MNTIGYSRPFALCSVISVTSPSSSVRESASATSAICCRKTSSVSSPLGRARVELAPDLHELLEVLDPALRLDRPFCLERLDVARLREHRLEQIAPTAARSSCSTRRRSSLHRVHEAPQRLDRGGAEPGDLSGAAAASQTDTPTLAEWATIRDSEVCPSPRRGELATRVKLTTSNGFASSER